MTDKPGAREPSKARTRAPRKPRVRSDKCPACLGAGCPACAPVPAGTPCDNPGCPGNPEKRVRVAVTIGTTHVVKHGCCITCAVALLGNLKVTLIASAVRRVFAPTPR